LNIPNEIALSKKLKFYNGLNFKNKFNLTSEEYQYLRTKYGVSKINPRKQRLCWKCDESPPSDKIKNTNLCTSCYKKSAIHYKKIYKIPDSSTSIVNKICLRISNGTF
jgi:hypothetical protein